MRLIIFALALFPVASLASQPHQAFVSLTVLKDGVVINSDGFVASDFPGFYSIGTQNGYPSVICSSNGTVLQSVSIFSGLTVAHRLTADGIELEINRYAVNAPPVVSANVAECKPAAPAQRILLAKKIVLPLDTGTKQMALGDGYSVSYSLSPEG